MSTTDFQSEQIANLDQLTKLGHRVQVLKELSRILKNGPPPESRPHLARIANRNHAYVLALRILHPVIREDREQIRVAGNDALNVYATSLMWIGALEESQSCLERIHGSTEALLTQAFLYFAQWEYAKAIPVLVKYIHSGSISDYQKLVGQINLLAAYIALGKIPEALHVFEPLILELTANPNYKLLSGNCFELRAQIEILKQSFEMALRYLAEAETYLADQPGRYLLYVNKWKALAQLGLDPENVSALQALKEVKAEASALKNWETIRDCDFHLARLNQDQGLIQRILLGTPYRGYRSRVESLFRVALSETRDLEYCPGSVDQFNTRCGLDLNEIKDHAFLSSTSWPLLQLMTKDIYRPPRMGVVFSALYKNEYFDPFTSPQRVRNCIFRFNEWAAQQDCAFRIKIDGGDFRLIGPADTSIRCTQRPRPLQSWQAALKVFKDLNQSRSFTNQELAKALGLSPRASSELLKKALQSNRVEKIGRGKNSRYIFFSGRRAA